jgi:hypothetical protein
MSIRRRDLLKGTASAMPLAAATRARKPNVLFIIADEWRPQSTGYNSDPNEGIKHFV